jgi:NAD(P)-dependent dehydrogenase (short-subunit alcohol dehydrogenase family)
MRRLEGKTAVITGASGGMGQAASRRFCEEGASVLGVDLDDAAGTELERVLRAAGHEFEFRRLDVTSTAEIKAFAAYVREKLEHLDVLYNNAGIILGKHLLETTDEEWDRIHDVNLKSVFILTRELAPLMKDGGSIINISSTGGLVAYESMTAYGAAKGGVAMFSRAAAVDLAPTIRVNAVCPGAIDTQMPRNFIRNLPDRDAVWSLFEDTLVGRIGRAEEVVALALWLASDESSFMTGAVIPIDGGWTAK